MPKIIEGLPILYGETGTEGNYFAVQRNFEAEKWSYSDQFQLGNNDYLIIYEISDEFSGHDHQIVKNIKWQGYVDLDLLHPLSEGHGYQRSETESWKDLFTCANNSNFRAILVKKEASK